MRATLLQALPAVLLAMLHPMLGLIFALAISGRTLVADTRTLYAWSSVVAGISAALALVNALPAIDAVDLAAGLALSMLAFAWAMRSTRSWLGAILGATAVQALYGVGRRFIFAAPYRQMAQTLRDLMLQALDQSQAQLEPANLELMRDMINRMSDFLIRFQEAIWTAPLLIGLYIGSLLLSRRVPFRWSHRTTRMPHGVVYALIVGMAMTLLQQTQTIGWNVVIILAWVYFIQGVMIIDFYWGRFLARSRLLTLVLVLAIMLNYFILALIILMGLLDTWFNFRKLPDTDTEDNSGDHSHTGNQ